MGMINQELLERAVANFRERLQMGMINQELLETAVANFRERLQMCILQNGHHLSDIFFRT